MSGGVDSSVAAALLREHGHEVVGCFMRLGSADEAEGLAAGGDASSCQQEDAALESGATLARTPRKQGCCSVNDAADAQLVAAQLGIPLYICNFKKDFGRVTAYFAAEYAAGRTPNPCVRCNDWLKFGKLFDYADQLGCDYVASGHYARVEQVSGGEANGASAAPVHTLLRGLDEDKDQSYVLFGVPRGRLARMMLPIGGLRKTRVRELAREFNLPVSDKPDSQEICFVPDNDYAAFLERADPGLRRSGTFVDQSGATIGAHSGHHQFTIGQRRRLGVASSVPLYVLKKDPGANTITLGPKDGLMAAGCRVGEANWLIEGAPEILREWTPLWVQHRSSAAPVAAEVRVIGEAAAREFEVRFDAPEISVTPGQALVVYSGRISGPPSRGNRAQRVVGGGWIAEAKE
ncbi:tRNA 2-thiouridine(34) synthase MnmA [soil metagenome]